MKSRTAGFRGRLVLLCLTLAAWMALPGATAEASTTCTWTSSNGEMNVDMGAASDFSVFYLAAGKIRIDGPPGPGTQVLCPNLTPMGPPDPTPANVVAIHIVDNSAGTTSVSIYNPAAFGSTCTQPCNPGEIKWDVAFGATGTDYVVLQGTAGADLFRAGASGIDFNAGAETLSFDSDFTATGAGFSSLDAQLQGGNDTLRAQGVSVGDQPFGVRVNVNGEDGQDTLIGGSVNDALVGGTEDDVIDGAGGNDSLDGGGPMDHDTVSYAFAPLSSGVNVSLAAVGPQPTGGAGTDTLTGFENLTGSNFGDTLKGDAANNVLDGGLGTDTLSYADAGAGVNVDLANPAAQNTGTTTGTDTISNIENLIGSGQDDTLAGNAGANVLNGGAGTDTVSYASAPAPVTVNLNPVTAQDTVGAGTDTLSNFVNLTGSPFSDSLKGSGLSGNFLSGGGGNDLLNGNPGGSDSYSGGPGTDTVTWQDCSDITCDAITANLAVTTPQDTIGAGMTTLTGVENLIGTHFDDHLTGNSSANRLTGGDGNDTLAGSSGSDRLYGDAGNDILRGSSGNDYLRGGSSNDQLYGDSGHDKLYGDSGNDRITGGSGRDWLYGLSGLDRLFAKDGTKDKRIDCGSGSNRHESAKYDKRRHKDPKPKSC